MSAIKRIVFFLHLVFDYVVDYLYDFYYRGQKQLAPPVRSPILLLSATEMARKVRQKEIKSEELVKLHMERIREINGLLNAVIDERFEKALEEARKVDEDIENGVYTEEDFEKKFFLGVPFTTKGTTHCEGLDVSFGIVGRKGMKGTEDADIVKFVKDTGAILIALTNVPQLSIWTETHNPVFGITRNPYDTTRNVGGSSGGEATLVASCSTAISVGTDIGGSVRIPSFMCGTFGHKCSTQLTSTKGLTYRDGSDRETTMVVTGPLARHAEDLIPGVKAVLGPAHKKLQLDKKVDVTKLRYHVVEELGDLYCSPARSEMKKSLAKVVKHFKEIAGNVESLNLEGFSHSAKLYRYWMSKDIKNFARDITGRKETLVWYKELIKYFTGKSDLSFSAVMVICNSQLLPDVDDSWATKTTDKLKSELLSKLGDDGVLLFLSSPTTAHHHHVSYLRPFNLAYFGIFNVLRLPATQVPLGLSADGLPLGVQVVAGPLQDHLCIAVAKELEKAFGGYVPPFKMEN